MAAKPSDALKKLQEQLTCSVCLDQFTNPKTLSCLHSFCSRCLEGLTNYNNEVKCPTCRSRFELGEEGVSSLQTAFLVNNLMEVQGMLQKVSNDKMVVCDICGESFAIGYCQQCESFTCENCLGFHNKWKKNSTHRVLTLEELADTAYDLPRVKSEVVMKCSGHNKPLDIFCETCDQLICQHCTVKMHRDHEYDVVNDVYDNQREAIENSVVCVDKLMKECEGLRDGLLAGKEGLQNEGQKVKGAIQERVSTIMDAFFTKADKLSQDVDRIIEDQEKRFDKKLDMVKLYLDKLTACKEHVEQSLSVGSPLQVLSSKTKLIEHTQAVVEGCDLAELAVQRQGGFKIKLEDGLAMNQSLVSKHIGKIHHENTLDEKPVHKVTPNVDHCGQSIVPKLTKCDNKPSENTASANNNHKCVSLEDLTTNDEPDDMFVTVHASRIDSDNPSIDSVGEYSTSKGIGKTGGHNISWFNDNRGNMVDEPIDYEIACTVVDIPLPQPSSSSYPACISNDDDQMMSDCNQMMPNDGIPPLSYPACVRNNDGELRSDDDDVPVMPCAYDDHDDY